MPVRKVRNIGKNIVGKFPSIKNRKMVSYESLIERDVIYLLEFDPEVVTYEEQPLTIEFTDEKKVKQYTPDFQAHFRSGHCSLIECKPERFASQEKNLIKYAAAESWCDLHNQTFVLAIDSKIRNGQALKNIQYLSQFAHHIPDIRLLTLLANNLRTPISIHDIIYAIDADCPSQVCPTIFHLLYYQHLFTPLLSNPISLQSPISTQKELQDGFQSIFPWNRISLER
ncbi:MAG: TnsA endonuclease N-terminal domain-containing protein [Chloroflexota bacterium]